MKFLVFVFLSAALLASCTTADLTPEQEKRFKDYIAQNCIITTTRDNVRVPNSERSMRMDSITIQFSEDLGYGWSRLVLVGSGMTRSQSMFVHDERGLVYCNERSWPGIDKARERAGSRSGQVTQRQGRQMPPGMGGDYKYALRDLATGALVREGVVTASAVA